MHYFPDRIPRRYRLLGLLISGTALYFFANIQRVAIPGSIFDVLQQELHVSAPYITAFGSSFMYIYALCQLGIGLLVDRYSGRRVIAFGAALFCIGSFLFPLSHTLTMLYLSRVLTGLGASALYLSMVREIMRVFDKNFTIFLSVLILIGYAGGIIANAPLVVCVNHFGWRDTLLAVAAGTVFFYLIFLLAKGSMRTAPAKELPFSSTPFRTVLAKRHNLYLFLFTGINFGLYYVLQTVIGKKFLEDYCQMSSGNAACILSVMGVISAFSGLGFAILSRMLGNRRQIFVRIVGVTCLLVFASLTVLLLLEIRTAWIAALLCLLSFTASTSSIAVPLLRETNMAKFSGVSVSLLNFSCYITVALLGNAVGFLMNLYPPQQIGDLWVYSGKSYLAVFGVMFLLSGIVTWCAFRLRETNGENMADETH
ncbi:MAG: MFS transporter [Planctomycetes bacterium]|nr:MFS transporter [Planctomycetota bacterium]